MTDVIDVSPRVWPLALLDGLRLAEPYREKWRQIERQARAYSRYLGKPPRVVSNRAPVRGRVLLYGGRALSCVGGALAFIGIAAPGDSVGWIFGLGFLLIVPTPFMIRRGRQLLQPSAEERLAADTREPVVFLRSFRDDDVDLLTGRVDAEGFPTLERLEEAIGAQFLSYGPSVGIGRPGELTPLLGASRNYYPDADWRLAIAAWMDRAFLLLVVPGFTSGLTWEIKAAVEHRLLWKLLVLMPPTTGQGLFEWDRLKHKFLSSKEMLRERETIRQRRWDNLRSALVFVPPFCRPPERGSASFACLASGS